MVRHGGLRRRHGRRRRRRRKVYSKLRSERGGPRARPRYPGVESEDQEEEKGGGQRRFIDDQQMTQSASAKPCRATQHTATESAHAVQCHIQREGKEWGNGRGVCQSACNGAIAFLVLGSCRSRLRLQIRHLLRSAKHKRPGARARDSIRLLLCVPESSCTHLSGCHPPLRRATVAGFGGKRRVPHKLVDTDDCTWEIVTLSGALEVSATPSRL